MTVQVTVKMSPDQAAMWTVDVRSQNTSHSTFTAFLVDRANLDRLTRAIAEEIEERCQSKAEISAGTETVIFIALPEKKEVQIEVSWNLRGIRPDRVRAAA